MKIAFAYDAGLPAPWMAGIQAFKRKLRNAGVRASVIVVPGEGIQGNVDLVLCTPTAADNARLHAPGARLIELETFARQPLYDDLVKELKAAQLPTISRQPPDQPVLVTYRGEERID